jgi:hypothetical protein
VLEGDVDRAWARFGESADVLEEVRSRDVASNWFHFVAATLFEQATRPTLAGRTSRAITCAPGSARPRGP